MKPEFLALNPFHHIPVLVDGERALIESFAIMDYLEARYPQPRLLPQDPDALATVRMVQMVTLNELIPATRPMTFKALFGKDDPDAIAKAQQQVAVVLQFWAQQLGDAPFFGGDTLTLADITAGTIAAWFSAMDISLAGYPNLTDWCARLNQRPSWQQTQVSQADLDAFKQRVQSRTA